MKLSEALIIRSDLQKRLEQIKSRLLANAKVQEGDTTNEDPVEILAELDQTLRDLSEIITKINLTNSQVIDGEKTMTQLLADREALVIKIKIYQDFLATARSKIDRYSNKEIKIFSAVDVKKEQNKLDELSKNLRILDVKIQSLNWQTDIVE